MNDVLEPAFGPTGKVVFDRTYARRMANGEMESWWDTARRVAFGNMALVHGDDYTKWPDEALEEALELTDYIEDFKILPAGRHLKMTGVPGRAYLSNCHQSDWGPSFHDHFTFAFMRLMEGGGVGGNYSTRFLRQFGKPITNVNLILTMNESHPDFEETQTLVPEVVGTDAFLHSFISEGMSEGSETLIVGDSREGWCDALQDLLNAFFREQVSTTLIMNLSEIRPKGSPLVSSGGSASGPAPFARMLAQIADLLNSIALSDQEHVKPVQAMEIMHYIGECVVSGGTRRSARMSIVDWDDPYIDEFLACKSDFSKHWTTNISVGIDSEFTELASVGFQLGGPDDISDDRMAQASRVFAGVVAGMLENGEPGFWNEELSQDGEVEPVNSPNPCSEIGLNPWDVCNLGHVNLDAFARDVTEVDMFRAHELVTRFLIRATFSDFNDTRQAEVVARNRRIGVGHLGVQAYLAKNEIKISDFAKGHTMPLDAAIFVDTLDELYELVRRTAREYAFQLRIPEPVKVTTVAPTGTIAKLPGTTEGIHPIYSRYFLRRVRFALTDPDQVAKVEDFRAQGYQVEQDIYDQTGNTAVVTFPTKDKLMEELEDLGVDVAYLESSDELSVDQMLTFQRVYQDHWADNAVSFTVNVIPGEVTADDLTLALLKHMPHLKGTTVFPDLSRPQSPYERITEEEYLTYSQRDVAEGTDEMCASGACEI